MKKLLYTFFTCLISVCSSGQIKTLDFERFKDCKLNISISYKDSEKDFTEAERFKDTEIILIHANKQGKVKSFERGYISTLVKNEYKGTFFESPESKNSVQHTAKFLLFRDKNCYCYNAKCFDAINTK